jgi:hypothetical protein
MAVGPEHKPQRPEDDAPQSIPISSSGAQGAQFGEALRQFVRDEGDDLTFESVHGQEEWHRSLIYPG